MTTCCEKSSTCFWNVIEYGKYTFSTILLLFSIGLVMACIFTGQSTAEGYNIHPVLACFLFWLLIVWLAIMEGGQGCLVGLKPIPKDKYKTSHPRSYKSCRIAHKGDNLERFIVGRQFLVVLIIFLINMMGAPSAGANFPKIPSWINVIFLGNSVAAMVTTITVGQLPPQVLAAVSLLDFINNYVMIATTYISLAIEFSGLLHAVYLIQYAFAFATGTNVESNESPRTLLQGIFFWVRVVFSLYVLGFALAVTISALLEGKSGMWDGISPGVSLFIFFLLLCFVGMMEGMQIAAFSLMNMPDEELSRHAMAHKNCTLMYAGTNLQSFLIGRQIFVASLMFIVARIASISIDKDIGETNIFAVPDGFQTFLDTGLLGAIVLTIIGSLAWRIVASSFPLLFMSNPIVFVIIHICFFFNSTGICSAAWLIASACKTVFRLKTDDEYLDDDDEDDYEKGNGKDSDYTATVISDEEIPGSMSFKVTLEDASESTTDDEDFSDENDTDEEATPGRKTQVEARASFQVCEC